MQASTTITEAARLEALLRLKVLDTDAESAFDEAVKLAASICGTPIALVNLLDGERQWFKARVGMDICQMPREHAFCEHLIGEQGSLVVSDTSLDKRFCDNPFVTGNPHLRFYAGVPLNTSEGFTVGSLCVLDTVPHELSESQTSALSALGRQVATQLELRAKLLELNEVLQEKERFEQELRKNTLLFSAFMEHSPTMAFMKDRDGRFVFYNRMFCERYEVDASEWIGKSVFDLFPEEFAAAYHAVDVEVMDSGRDLKVDETSPGPHNTVLYWRTHKFRVVSDAGELLLGGISLDISSDQEAVSKLKSSHEQLELANQELVQRSTTDALTGLRNRRAFDEQLEQSLRSKEVISLILLDVDHFKQHNDSHGHQAGDEILREVAKLLVQACRGHDCIARIGGEEFAILLKGAGIVEAARTANRLRQEIAEHTWRRGAVTISAGVAPVCPGEASASKLFFNADRALYLAKNKGRNCVEVADC